MNENGQHNSEIDCLGEYSEKGYCAVLYFRFFVPSEKYQPIPYVKNLRLSHYGTVKKILKGLIERLEKDFGLICARNLKVYKGSWV